MSDYAQPTQPGCGTAEPSIENVRKSLGLTRAMSWALQVAARRPTLALCPVVTSGNGKISAAAEEAVLAGLHARGLIEYDGPVPRVSRAGLDAVNAILGTLPSVPPTGPVNLGTAPNTDATTNQPDTTL